VTHFSLIRRGDNSDDGDFDELLQVLRARFGAVDDGKIIGPYSLHHFMTVDGLRFGIILDCPGPLDLYATERSQTDAMRSFVARLLEALNEETTSDFDAEP
jgi:hypothetical protein